MDTDARGWMLCWAMAVAGIATGWSVTSDPHWLPARITEFRLTKDHAAILLPEQIRRDYRVQFSLDLAAWTDLDVLHSYARPTGSNVNHRMYTHRHVGQRMFYRALLPTNTVRILRHPLSQFAEYGKPLTLSVEAEGEILSYLWTSNRVTPYINGVAAPWATNRTIEIPSIRTWSTAEFAVTVFGRWEWTQSRTAVIRPVTQIPVSPEHIRGYIVRIDVSNGRRPFITRGSYRMLTHHTADTYQIAPITFIGASSGHYAYAKSGDTTATIEIDDTLVGRATGFIEFIDGKVGVINLFSDAGDGFQTGTFVVEDP